LFVRPKIKIKAQEKLKTNLNNHGNNMRIVLFFINQKLIQVF